MTISQFALSAALKKINRKISLCPSPEMYRLFEKSIRGGLAFCNKHIVTASNQYVFGDVKHNEKSLMYIDENNLYGAALRIPVKDFKYLEPDTVNIDWKTIDTEGDIGYLLEVDLQYPEAIHNKTKHFPLALKDFEITDAHISKEMRIQLRALNGCREHDLETPMKSCRKLVANCDNKSNYVAHFKTLKFYLQQGLEIARIHTIVQFGQAAIYKDYIDFNTNERSKAKSDFKKSYYKQINCSLFGKSMEDVRNRTKVRMMSNAVDYQHEVAKPHFLSATILAPNLVLTKRTNANVCLKSTIAIGAAVLDLSKVIMYDLVYNKLPAYESRFKCKIIPVGGDTDSLFLLVKNVNVYECLIPEMIKDELLDTSNYPKTHAKYSNNLNAKLGCVKDEFKGAVCSEIIMLTPKCYSMRIENEKSKCAANGVGRETIKTLNHDDYGTRILNCTELLRKVSRFQSFKHKLFSIRQTKVALTFFDNKRFWIGANESLPYGHYKCKDNM